MNKTLSGKTALITNISIDDEILVMAAQKLGLKIVATSNSDPANERVEAQRFYSDIPFYNLPSAFDRQISTFSMRLLNFFFLLRIKRKHEIDSILKTPRYLEYKIFSIFLAWLIPFLRYRIPTMGLHWDKSLYLKKLQESGISVPEMYKVIGDQDLTTKASLKIAFPCICKPAYCSGGNGVVVARSLTDLDFIFGPEKNPENFSPLNLYYRNRNRNGLRNYIYNSGHFGGPYLIQEYIQGKLFSVSGVVIKGKVKSIFCYEIGSTENQYCAEQSFSWPVESFWELRLTELAQKLVTSLDYPDGPMMLDAILSSDDQLNVIDAGPRASLTGARLSAWAFEDNDHAEDIVTSHWGILSNRPNQRKGGRPIYWQRFPFPKGHLESIDYPEFKESFIVHHDTPLQTGDAINEPRLDRQMVERGSLVTTGTDLQEARQLWNKTFEQIKWSIV